MALALALLLAASPRLVVPDVGGHGVSEDLKGSVTDALVASVRRQAKGFDVLGGNEMQGLIKVQGDKQRLSCGDAKDVSCLVEIGGALGADRMVFGSLDRVGKSFFLDVKLIDVPHARVLQESTATLKSEDELLGAAVGAARELFGAGAGMSPQTVTQAAPPAAQPLATPSAPAPAPAPPAKADGLRADGVKVYAGPDGLLVALVWLAPRNQNQVLVRVSGGNSPFEGKVLLHTFSGEDDVRIATRWHGRDWGTVQSHRRPSAPQPRWELFLPGVRDGIPIAYDKAESQSLKVEPLLEEYRRERDSGELTALARFDRDAEIAPRALAYRQLLDDANHKCGSQTGATIEWPTISDEVLRRYSIESYCGSPLEALGARCESDPAFKPKLAKIRQVVCRFGTALGLDLDRGKLTFTTAPEASNQLEWIRSKLDGLPY